MFFSASSSACLRPALVLGGFWVGLLCGPWLPGSLIELGGRAVRRILARRRVWIGIVFIVPFALRSPLGRGQAGSFRPLLNARRQVNVQVVAGVVKAPNVDTTTGSVPAVARFCTLEALIWVGEM